MFIKKNGFTLVELLVSIVIFSIISLISLPLIRNLESIFENRKYTVYKDSITHSAKLYVDAYGDDLFSNLENGCVLIHYSDMADKRLIKDIDMDDFSCDTSETFVKVVKSKSNYDYTPYLGCGTKKDGHAVLPEMLMPEDRSDLSSCIIDDVLYTGG